MGICHAASGVHLRELLRGNHRYVFILIHKFQTPELPCDRPDVIVLTDEAHRSQYDTLALNMRAALPKALFLAFTGTPLIAGEDRRRTCSAITCPPSTSSDRSRTALPYRTSARTASAQRFLFFATFLAGDFLAAFFLAAPAIFADAFARDTLAPAAAFAWARATMAK